MGQVAPVSNSKTLEIDIHNPRTLKLDDFIAKMLTQASDLTVAPLHKSNFRNFDGYLFNLAFFSDYAEHRYTMCHIRNEFICNGFVDCDNIFFFMVFASS